LSFAACAQPYAPGEAVVIPGAEIGAWGRVASVEGHFGKPSGNSTPPSTKLAAVLILHGSNGIDGRGAYYAKALQEAGIATLEITMFESGGRPRAGTRRRSLSPQPRSNGWPHETTSIRRGSA
jgi:hypothetical protein